MLRYSNAMRMNTSAKKCLLVLSTIPTGISCLSIASSHYLFVCAIKLWSSGPCGSGASVETSFSLKSLDLQ
jgi:hypothetical protein